MTILFSDRGTPRDFRHMDGHSSHTYMWYNEKGEHVWVKYHFKTDKGYETYNAQEAEFMAGHDPNHSTRDLFDSIEKGDFPSWTLYVQIMTPEQAKSYRFDPFDVTKVWYHADFPLIEVGRMVLNKNPENHFAEIEQAAFAPSNFVPGIAASPDKMLQGRLFAYADAHRYRLGTNFHQIPVNMPKGVKAHYNNMRDGSMTVDGNHGAEIPSYPSSINPQEVMPQAAPPPIPVEGLVARQVPPLTDDDFVQAGELYRRVLDKNAQDNLISNIVGHLGGAKKEIQYRQAAVFFKADREYGTRVAQGLKLDTGKVEELAKNLVK